MTTIPLADAKARLSAVLDEVRDTHDRVVITRNGRPEAVIMSVSDLEALEETLDLLSTPGALEEIRAAEAEIARGEAIGADELQRQMEQRMRAEQSGEWVTRHTPCPWLPPLAAPSLKGRLAACRWQSRRRSPNS